MKLIDADALTKELQRWDWQDAYLPIHFKDYLIDEAPTIKTKQVKYYDEEENVWKVGSVIVDE